MEREEYEIIIRDSKGNEKKLNSMISLCEIMWDACFAVEVDYADDPTRKELVKTASFVCKWVARLQKFFEKGV